MEDRKYLIICLRNNCWNRYDNVVFWGKNRNGYSSNLAEAGLYTKEEALKICDKNDCFISIDKIGVTKEMLNFSNPNIELKVKKTDDICKYINSFVKIMRNKEIMKYGA